MNKMDIFLLIVWIFVGIINIAGAAANGGVVSIASYICCWIVLIVFLTIRCFDN